MLSKQFAIRNMSLLLALTIILFTSCNAKLNRQLAWHESELSRAANGNLPPEEQLDILMNSFVTMTEESLKPISPKKGVRYVKKYSKMNQKHIDKILSNIQSWQQNMSDKKRIITSIRLIKKPYIKKIIELVPKFEKKYKQYAFAMKMTRSITGGLKKFGGSLLSF